MESNKPFSLPAVLRAETSTAEDENHWTLSLQFRELPPLRGMIGKLIVGEHSPWNDVMSHMKQPFSYWNILEHDHTQREEPRRKIPADQWWRRW
jgi:hypothetical protein